MQFSFLKITSTTTSFKALQPTPQQHKLLFKVTVHLIKYSLGYLQETQIIQEQPTQHRWWKLKEKKKLIYFLTANLIAYFLPSEKKNCFMRTKILTVAREGNKNGIQIFQLEMRDEKYHRLLFYFVGVILRVLIMRFLGT